MCVSPIRIKNPYKGAKLTKFTKLHDCTADYINVPCGHCSECLARKQMEVVQRVQMELCNHYAFFFTLTYDDKHLPILTEYTSEGGEVLPLDKPIRFADLRDVTLMMKRIRNYNQFTRPFKYIVCSERGSKRHRPHIHGFIFIDKYAKDDTIQVTSTLENIVSSVLLREWRRRDPNSPTKSPRYEPLFQFHTKITPSGIKSNFDCHYVNPSSSKNGEADAAFYVTKYIFKADDFERRLKSAIYLNYATDAPAIWNKVKSQNRRSHFVGLDSDYSSSKCRDISKENRISSSVYDHIRKHVLSTEPYPTFANPVNGQLFPLARYYRNIGSLFTYDDIETLYNRYNIPGTDWCRLEDNKELSKSDVQRRERNNFKRHKMLDDRLDESIIEANFEPVVFDTLDFDDDMDLCTLQKEYYNSDPNGTLASLRFCFDLEPLGVHIFASDLPDIFQSSEKLQFDEEFRKTVKPNN